MEIIQEMQIDLEDLEFFRILAEDDDNEHTTTFLAMMNYFCKLYLSSPNHSKVILGHMKSELYAYSEMLFQNECNEEYIVVNTAMFFDNLHLLSKTIG